MSENNFTPPEIKRQMLASWGGIVDFKSDPPFANGKEHKGAIGFWLCSSRGDVVKVAGRKWASAFPIEKTAEKDLKLSAMGGRIVIGFSNVNGKPDVQRIEDYVPDLVTEVLAPELVGSGWTIGRFGHGRYVAPNGQVFNERSTMVVIAGIDSEKLLRIARKLAIYLNQTYVLLFDDNTGDTTLVGQDEPSGTIKASWRQRRGRRAKRFTVIADAWKGLLAKKGTKQITGGEEIVDKFWIDADGKLVHHGRYVTHQEYAVSYLKERGELKPSKNPNADLLKAEAVLLNGGWIRGQVYSMDGLGLQGTEDAIRSRGFVALELVPEPKRAYIMIYPSVEAVMYSWEDLRELLGK